MELALMGLGGLEDEEEISFCELLQEVDEWLSASSGSDLCDPRHMFAVGMQLITSAQLLANFQFMPAGPEVH